MKLEQRLTQARQLLDQFRLQLSSRKIDWPRLQLPLKIVSVTALAFATFLFGF